MININFDEEFEILDYRNHRIFFNYSTHVACDGSHMF